MAIETTDKPATPGASGNDTININSNAVPGAGGFTAGRPNVTPGFGMGAMSFFENFGIQQATPEIEKYLEEVTEGANRGSDGKKSSIVIDRIRLADPAGAYAFIAKGASGIKVASVVIFSDIASVGSALSGEFTPPSRLLVQAHAKLTEQDPNLQIVNVYVITARDLLRSSQMANCLRSDLIPFATGMSHASAADIAANMDFFIEANTEQAKRAIDSMSPHAVPSRVDVGFMVTFKPKNNQNLQVGQGARITEQAKPYLAVGGYTEVFGPYPDPNAQNRMKYIPVFKITEIVAVAPVMGSILVAVLAAVQLICQQGLWLQQFSSFAKGAPNLGNMMLATGGKMWHAETIQDRDEFVATNFQQPYLALSIVEGRRRIPMLAMFEDPAKSNQIYAAAARFFGAKDGIPGATQVGQIVGVDYIGVYGSGDNLRDSRDLTYLDLAAKNAGVDPNVASTLLRFSKTPKDRAQLASQYLQGFQPLYREVTVALHSDFLGLVSRQKGAALNLTDVSGGLNYMPALAMSGNFNNFSTFSPIIGMGVNGQNLGGQQNMWNFS